MEDLQEFKKKNNNGNRKRKSQSHSNTGNTDRRSNTLTFPLLMAAALSHSHTNTNTHTVVKDCLTKFLSHPIQPHEATCILSLCPLLLRSKSPYIATLTAQFVGAVSLLSFEMNHQVVSDFHTLKALISLIPTSRKAVSMAACDGLLDICSTCLGRQRLLLFSALETLMFAFLEVQGSSTLISLSTGDDVNIASLRIGFQKGDVLYIPRGCPHEACTHYNKQDGSVGFSLHLTLGVEVEPPFEWEGFMHIALFCWKRTQHNSHPSLKSLSGILNVMSTRLLHIVIGLIGNSDPAFRKACLVAAASSQSNTNSWLDQCQRTIFSYLINKISRELRFQEALKSVEAAIERNEDPFQQIKWLGYLNQERESVEGHDWDLDWYVGSTEIKDIFAVYVEYKEMAERVFMDVKSKFCNEVSYDDVTANYKLLHEKYEEVRKQYMNGMLSLHSI